MGILEVFFDAKVTKTLVLCSDKIFAALTLDNRLGMKKGEEEISIPKEIQLS